MAGRRRWAKELRRALQVARQLVDARVGYEDERFAAVLGSQIPRIGEFDEVPACRCVRDAVLLLMVSDVELGKRSP